jgi:hypothetical protein
METGFFIACNRIVPDNTGPTGKDNTVQTEKISKSGRFSALSYTARRGTIAFGADPFHGPFGHCIRLAHADIGSAYADFPARPDFQMRI